jgi:hypothetical protein
MDENILVRSVGCNAGLTSWADRIIKGNESYDCEIEKIGRIRGAAIVEKKGDRKCR